MLIQEQKRNCYNCKNPILRLSRYCCDEKKYFCLKCSSNRCRICGMLRIYNHINTQMIQAKVFKKNRCCNCGKNDEPPEREFFYEEKCKMYYCHACIIVFYDKYFLMIKKFQKQFGNTPQMQVELRCGCEIQTEKIVNFAQRYCYDCSEVMIGRKMLLKNKCILMKKCYDYIKLQTQKPSYNKAKFDKVKAVYYELRQLVIFCNNCKDQIDGYNSTIGDKIGDIFLCNYCFEISKRSEEIYQQKISEKQKKQAKILLQKVQQKSSNVEQKPKLQQIFNLNQCKICFNAESNMINKVCRHLMMCYKCYSDCSAKKGSQIIECPACKTLGEYIEFFTPIYL